MSRRCQPSTRTSEMLGKEPDWESVGQTSRVCQSKLSTQHNNFTNPREKNQIGSLQEKPSELVVPRYQSSTRAAQILGKEPDWESIGETSRVCQSKVSTQHKNFTNHREKNQIGSLQDKPPELVSPRYQPSRHNDFAYPPEKNQIGSLQDKPPELVSPRTSKFLGKEPGWEFVG